MNKGFSVRNHSFLACISRGSLHLTAPRSPVRRELNIGSHAAKNCSTCTHSSIINLLNVTVGASSMEIISIIELRKEVAPIAAPIDAPLCVLYWCLHYLINEDS